MARLNGSWYTVVTGLALGAGQFTQLSVSDIDTIIADATERQYSEFEVSVEVTAGTPTEGESLDVHVRMAGEPAPSSGYEPHFMGSVILDDQSGTYRKDGIFKEAGDATLYLMNNHAASLTVTVQIRPKDFGAAS